MKKFITYIFFFLLSVSFSHAQDAKFTIPSIDSLEFLEHQNHAKVFLKVLNSNLNKPLTTQQKHIINTYKVIALVEAELFDEALQLSQTLVNKTNVETNLIIKTRIKRALIYEVLGKFKKCENELKILKNIFEEYPKEKDDDYGEYLFRYASFYRVQGKIDKALPYNQQSIAFAEANNYPRVAGVAYMVQGLLTPQNQYNTVKTYYYKALNQFSKNNDSLGIAGMYLNLGNLYNRQKAYKMALKYCDSALTFSKPFSHYFAATYAYRLKSDIFNSLKKTDSAYVNFKKFHDASLHISYDKQELKVNQLEYNFLVEKEQVKLDQVFKDNKKLRVYIISLIIALAFLGIALTLITRKNKIIHSTKEAIKAANFELASNVKDKEVLLKELHHRVKNNLSLILSLINFQTEEIDDAFYKSKFNTLQQRIEAIAIVHEQMMQKSNHELDDTHNVNDYINKIAQSLINLDTRNVNLEITIPEILVNLDVAVPLGILINELISNSLKHARVEQKLQISIYIKEENNTLVINYNDNGTEFENDLNKQNLGLFIIDSMITQLKGKYKREESNYIITIQKNRHIEA